MCYANDVALLAPSPFALKNMLSTCINLLIVVIMMDSARKGEEAQNAHADDYFFYIQEVEDLGMLYVNMRL